MSYNSVRTAWKEKPDEFWAAAAKAIDWTSPWSQVVSTDRPSGRWFADAAMNTCFNAVDRHAKHRGDKLALVFDSAMTGDVRRFTYQQLLQNVEQFAGAMQRAGVEKGDRVVIYMPMVPESVIAMLACARLGAIHSVVFGGFAARELAIRISEAKPKIVLSASCGLEPGRTVAYKPLLDEALALSSHQPQCSVVLQRPELAADMSGPIDQDWQDFVAGADAAACVDVQASDPLYILYTSGTTGQPKGIVRDNGGHAVALHWSMRAVYDIGPEDVFWAASDIGWVVGHSYIVYGPLLAGATTVMFEGKPVGTPDAGAFWRVIDTHNVNVLFTAPTAIRAIKRDDPNLEFAKSFDLSSLRALFLAGERCDPDTLQWAEGVLDIPVIDHWWQTETGWAIAGSLLGEGETDVRAGSAGRALPGWEVRVVNDEGVGLPAGNVGAIVCELPLAPGSVCTLWNADERFSESYFSEFPGFYETGDAGYIDDDGYIYVMSRTDDVINVAGHRLSTGALEEVLATHPAVAECAVTGVSDALKGQTPLGFLCLKAGSKLDESQVVADCVTMIREQIGPVAAFRRAVVVNRLPKTRSGKILRSTLSKIVDRIDFNMPPTIDDPEILTEIRNTLLKVGVLEE